MFGGGIGAHRTYKKGSSKIKVEILTDSPVLQSMMGLFTNPMFATADGGNWNASVDKKRLQNTKKRENAERLPL